MDASSDKWFRKCVPPCQRYLTLEDTYDLCVICLVEDHASSVLEQAECVDCEVFSTNKHCSRLSIFSRELGQASAPEVWDLLQPRLSGDSDRGDRR